jgi:hypothetical protein
LATGDMTVEAINLIVGFGRLKANRAGIFNTNVFRTPDPNAIIIDPRNFGFVNIHFRSGFNDFISLIFIFNFSNRCQQKSILLQNHRSEKKKN